MAGRSINSLGHQESGPRSAATAREYGASNESPKDDDENWEWSTFHRLMDQVALGRAQFMIMLGCGAANASDAVGMYSLSFLLPSEAECTLGLQDSRKSWLAMLLFVGMMFGSWLWGWLSDVFGRRPALLLALVINFVAATAAAFAPSFDVLLPIVLVSGLGLGGCLPIVLTYFSEFVPAAHRGALISWLGVFWFGGTLAVTGLAWGLLGTTECARHSTDGRPWAEVCAAYANHTCGFTHLGAELNVETWRIFQLACSLCPLIAIGCLYFAPESPQWLFAHGRHAECRAVLAVMAARNQSAVTWVEPRKSAAAAAAAADVDVKTPLLGSPATSGPSSGRGPAYALWVSPLKTKINLLVTASIWAVLSFGFYGFSMWRPQYFSSHSSSPGDMYWLSFVVGVGSLPGNVLSIFIMDRVGHKLCFIITGLLAGVFILGVLLVKNTAGMTAFSAAFGAITVVTWNALDVLGPELFPTELRATAFGLQAAAGRLFSILAQLVYGLFSGHDTVIPLALTISVLCLGSLLVLLLPNTTGKHTN